MAHPLLHPVSDAPAPTGNPSGDSPGDELPADAQHDGLDPPTRHARRLDEPGPEEARRWRFDRRPGPEARQAGSPRIAGGAAPGTALVPGRYEWGDRSGEPPDWDVLGFLWRRKLRIGVAAAIAMAVLTLAIYLVPESYRASSTVVYQGDYPSASRDDEAQREPSFAPDTLANEVEALTSDELLTKVVLSLDLLHEPEIASTGRMLPAWLAGPVDRLKDELSELGRRLGVGPGARGPAPAANDALPLAVSVLRSRLTIAPVGISRVVRITAQAHRPELAATLANAVAQAYVQSRADAKLAATRDAHQWIQQRLAMLHERALQSAQVFDRFRHDSGAVRGKDGTVSQEQISQVSAELTQARQLRSTLQLSLAQTAGNSDADLGDLTSATASPLLARLREQLAIAVARQAELAVTANSAMPGFVANRALVAELSRLIARERGRIRATLQGKLAVAQANEERLGAALDALKAKVERADSNGAEMRALERTADADADVYRNFASRAERTDPDLTYQPASVRVLSRASVPIRAASPNRKLLLPGALVASLGIGTVAALVKDRRRRGVVSLRHLPRPDGQAPLGMLPLVRRLDRKMSRVWDEAVAQILARMLLPHRGVPPASLLVTSAMPREGKTRVAIALAAAATRRGLRVLLVDADLRRQALSREAGLTRASVTLVELLNGEVDAAEAAVHHAGWSFAVLPAGNPVGSPIDLLATEAWENALRDLEGLFDLVIIDTPPALAVGDTWMMARFADATVVLAEWGVTDPATVELAVEQLMTAQARVLGLVLTKVAPREHASQGSADSAVFSRDLLRYHAHGG